MPRSPRKYLDTTFFHIMTQGINKNYIKGKYNISFRTISKNINMGRETIRKEYYK